MKQTNICCLSRLSNFNTQAPRHVNINGFTAQSSQRVIRQEQQHSNSETCTSCLSVRCCCDAVCKARRYSVHCTAMVLL